MNGETVPNCEHLLRMVTPSFCIRRGKSVLVERQL